MEAQRAAWRLILSAGLLALVADGQGKVYKKAPPPKCPGAIPVDGIKGDVQIVPTGWIGVPAPIPIVSNKKGLELRPTLESRAYFASECTAGNYSSKQYLAENFLGKSLKFTVDVSGAGCGCNAAFYLTNMRQNPHESECHDHYCDANNVCGESCAEIDIMEANEHAWHTTLHTAQDHEGFGGGYGGGDGWAGPRDFLSSQYGPGASSIDTKKPFDVVCSFKTDADGELRELEVVLTQEGSDAPLRISLPEYPGNADLTKALHSGMTPIVSYWQSKEMLWMDGTGDDGQGPCETDDCECGETVVFGNFSVFEIEEQELPPHEDVTWEEGEVPLATEDAPESDGQQDSGTDEEQPMLSPVCPGKIDFTGEEAVSIVPAGWKDSVGKEVELDQEAGAVVPHLGGRAYFSEYCVPGQYESGQYMALELLGKRLKFTVDLGGAGCGCVAELRLMPMRFNTNPTTCSDFYCDASSLCGESCAEVDIMRANMHAWHSNLRAKNDHMGIPAGYGGAEGPREWAKEDYGPGAKCIDTTEKFDVEVSFPVDYKGHLAAMEVMLSQKECSLSLRLANYPQEAEISEAMQRGVTPVVSYWTFNDTLWLDGPGLDRKGPCTDKVLRGESPCADKVAVAGFAVEHIGAPSSELVDGVPEAKEEHADEFGGECVGGWAPHADCVASFQHEGVDGKLPACTMLHVEHWAWCSLDEWYASRWEHCEPCNTDVDKGKWLKSETCLDTVGGWTSSSGRTCLEYFYSDWCTPEGKTGSSWNESWGEFSDWASDGVSADEACCLCGGGIKKRPGLRWPPKRRPAPAKAGNGSCSGGWQPSRDCPREFVYNDKKYEGCTAAGTPKGSQRWCSLTPRYSGSFANCTRCGDDQAIADVVNEAALMQQEVPEPRAALVAPAPRAPRLSPAGAPLALAAAGAAACLLAVARGRRGAQALYLRAEERELSAADEA